MYKENVIDKIVCKLNVSDDLDTMRKSIMLPRIDKVFSYIIFKQNDKIRVQYNISQTNKYNTLKTNNEIDNVLDIIINSDNCGVIGYKQPSLELMLKLYKPLILSLSKEQKEHWQQLEMEDLIQMCSLVICDLYYKGYYIHKKLIKRSFINYVLQHIKKERGKFTNTVSFEHEFMKKDNDDALTIADIIPDKQLIYEEMDKDNAETQCRILQEVKDLVVDYIGIRQYDQLLREYANGQTTDWSRKLMQRIKAHLFEMGISKKSFNKYYN